VLINALQFGMPLAAAIAHPRVHVDTTGDIDRLRAEPGLELPDVGLPVANFPDLNMYFGGVSVAKYARGRGFDVEADARREGGIFLSDA